MAVVIRLHDEIALARWLEALRPEVSAVWHPRVSERLGIAAGNDVWGIEHPVKGAYVLVPDRRWLVDIDSVLAPVATTPDKDPLVRLIVEMPEVLEELGPGPAWKLVSRTDREGWADLLRTVGLDRFVGYVLLVGREADPVPVLDLLRDRPEAYAAVLAYLAPCLDDTELPFFAPGYAPVLEEFVADPVTFLRQASDEDFDCVVEVIVGQRLVERGATRLAELLSRVYAETPGSFARLSKVLPEQIPANIRFTAPEVLRSFTRPFADRQVARAVCTDVLGKLTDAGVTGGRIWEELHAMKNAGTPPCPEIVEHMGYLLTHPVYDPEHPAEVDRFPRKVVQAMVRAEELGADPYRLLSCISHVDDRLLSSIAEALVCGHLRAESLLRTPALRHRLYICAEVARRMLSDGPSPTDDDALAKVVDIGRRVLGAIRKEEEAA